MQEEVLGYEGSVVDRQDKVKGGSSEVKVFGNG